jgi:hypothetical protein
MLLRLAYLGITNAFALLRLLPGSDGDQDAEILVLRLAGRVAAPPAQTHLAPSAAAGAARHDPALAP